MENNKLKPQYQVLAVITIAVFILFIYAKYVEITVINPLIENIK